MSELDGQTAIAVPGETTKVKDTDASPADPPIRDKPPRPRSTRGGKRPGAGRPKGSKNKTPAKSTARMTDSALQASLGQLLALPPMACAAIPDEDTRDFMVGHFTAYAGVFVERVIAISHRDEGVRDTLEKLTASSVKGELVMLGIVGVAPPALWAFGFRAPAEAADALMFGDPEDFIAAVNAQPRPSVRSADGEQNEAQGAESDAAAAAAAVAAAQQAQARAA